MYCLTLALEKQATNFIFKGMADDWPIEKAHLVVKDLMRKFHPCNATSECEFSNALKLGRIGCNCREFSGCGQESKLTYLTWSCF
jgi:hypothetical protein